MKDLENLEEKVFPLTFQGAVCFPKTELYICYHLGCLKGFLFLCVWLDLQNGGSGGDRGILQVLPVYVSRNGC